MNFGSRSSHRLWLRTEEATTCPARRRAAGTVSLSISLNPESRVVPGEYRLRIQARAANNASVSDTAFALGRDPAGAPGTAHDPAEWEGRAVPSSSINSNSSMKVRTSAHYTLQASDPGHELQYRFRTNIITVEPGPVAHDRPRAFASRRRGRDSVVQFQVEATPAKGTAAFSDGRVSVEPRARLRPLPGTVRDRARHHRRAHDRRDLDATSSVMAMPRASTALARSATADATSAGAVAPTQAPTAVTIPRSST